MKKNKKIFKACVRFFCTLLLIIPNNGFSFFNVLLMRRPISLEVPIELTDTGLDADTTAHTFENTRTSLDTGDYDGIVTYSFELVVASTEGSLSRTVDLLDTGGTVKASISVPANTPATRRRTTFTPTAGASDYRVKTPIVTFATDIAITAARIIVSQVNATKTKLYYPLMSDLNAYSNATGPIVEMEIDAVTGTTWTATNTISIRWLKDSNNLATVASGNAWTLEAVLASPSGVGTAKVALAQNGTTIVVTGSTASTAATTPTLVSVSFANTATNFTDNTVFQAKVSHSTASTIANIYKVGIWVKLVNLSKGSVLYRVGRGGTDISASGTYYRPTSRALINTTAFSRPVIYYEDTGQCPAASCTTSLYDNGTNDSGTTSPTPVTSSTNTPPTAYGRTRSSAITLTSSDRFFAGYTKTSTGSYILVNAAIVVNFSR